METDLLLFILLGIVQIFMAVWGGVVSARTIENRHERHSHFAIFAVLGILAIVFTAASGYRSYESNKENARAQGVLKHDVEEANTKMEKSLQAEQYLRGQLESIGLMVGKLGNGNSADAKLADAIIKMANSGPRTAPPTVFPNRHLGLDQAESLAGSLARMPSIHVVAVSASSQDSEAWNLRSDYIRTFREAHLTVQDKEVHPGYCPGGISISLGHPEDWLNAISQELDAAFARAQISVHSRGVDTTIPDGQFNVCIGFNDGK